MAVRKTKRKAGRPEVIIDWDVVGSYLRAQCNTVGIASILGISTDSLYLKCKKDNSLDYTAFSEQKKGEGKEMLRAKQFTTAMGSVKDKMPPNISMQIWLGKQYLGQRDKNELTGADGKDLIPARILTKKEASQLFKDLTDGKFPKV